MNVTLRANIRTGAVRRLGEDYEVGPFSFTTMAIDRARFCIAMNQPVYLVGVCTNKMMMVNSPKPSIICSGEAIWIDLSRFIEAVKVRYDESSFFTLLVDFLMTRGTISADDASAVYTLAARSAIATSVKYSFKRLDVDDGWLFVDQNERDKMVLQAISYLSKELLSPKLAPIKDAIINRCSLIVGRNNALSRESNAAVIALIDRYKIV